MTAPHPGDDPIDAERVRSLAALVGVAVDDARATGLATQAQPYFALLRALDAVDPAGCEPAAEFRLDQWRSGVRV